MSETTPAPKPTPKPWREAVLDEILTAMREMEDHVEVWINRLDYHSDSVEVARHHLSREFAEILAKHDPANARPIEFSPDADLSSRVYRVGQVWRGKGGDREIVRFARDFGGNNDQSAIIRHGHYSRPQPQDIYWRRPGGPVRTLPSWLHTWFEWARTAQLIADPNDTTTPAPPSGQSQQQ